jgi:hypothetical protein
MRALGEPCDVVSHCGPHPDRANSRVRTRHGIIEEHHQSVPGEALERSFEAEDELAERLVILAQNAHRLLRLGRLGKRRKAAQVAKNDRDLAAVAFEKRLVARRDD